MSLSLAIGCVTTLTGLASLTNVISTGMHPGVYDVLALLTAFASATVIVLIRQLHAKEHTSTIFAAQCVYGLLICAVPALCYTKAFPPMAMTKAFRELPVGEGSLLQMLVPLGVALTECCFSRNTTLTPSYSGPSSSSPTPCCRLCDVSAACSRLASPRSIITTVAHELGFSSSQYFVTVFRRFTGTTPSAYQRQQPSSKA